MIRLPRLLGVVWLVCLLWIAIDWLATRFKLLAYAKKGPWWLAALSRLWLDFSREAFWFFAVAVTGPLGFLAHGIARELEDIRRIMRPPV